MPLLSSLPFLSQQAVAFFESHDILTVETFLAQDVELLPGMEGRTEECKERRQALADIMTYLETTYTGVQSGDAFRQLPPLQRFVPTGCESLDDMLQGGMIKGTLTELVGASASGKTQALLMAMECRALDLKNLSAATVAFEQKALVTYVDTTNSFSAKRTANILGGRLGTRERIQDASQDLKRAMSSIYVHRLFSIFSLFDFIQELDTTLQAQSQASDDQPKVSLVIVDSASSLISPILMGRSPLGHGLMRMLGFMLKKVAHEHNLAILITNHTVSGDDGQTKPALGESWKSVPHVRLLLERDANALCRATVLHHTSMVGGKQATFRISRGGLKNVVGINRISDEVRAL